MLNITKAEAIAYAKAHMEVRYATSNGAYTAKRDVAVQGDVNHSVGCAQPSADVFFNLMNKSSAGWGVSAILGDFHQGEGRIIVALPWDEKNKKTRRNWGVGSGSKGSWNNTHIQWEICEPAGHTYAGGTMIGYDVAKNQAYFDRMWKLVVCWNVYICSILGIKAKDIHDHRESYLAGMGGNHADVSHWWPKHGKSMDALRAEVAAILDAPAVVVDVDYRAKVTASTLNCRTSNNTSATIVRTYPEGAVLHISKESEGWGYTGEGWVSLSWVEKTVEEVEPEMTAQEVEALIDKKLKEQEEKRHYATLADVPASYKPAISALMDAGVLRGYDGGKDGKIETVGDNTLKVDEMFCRVVTMLSRPKALEALRSVAGE